MGARPELLALADTSVSAVSAAVGLRKADHMRKLFREGLAMTPAEWRLASRPMRVQLTRTSAAPEAAAPSDAGVGARFLAAPNPTAFPPSTLVPRHDCVVVTHEGSRGPP